MGVGFALEVLVELVEGSLGWNGALCLPGRTIRGPERSSK